MVYLWRVSESRGGSAVSATATVEQPQQKLNHLHSTAQQLNSSTAQQLDCYYRAEEGAEERNRIVPYPLS